MEKNLAGKRIAVGGSRKIEEIKMLIEKQGGIPLVRSLQGTVFLAEKELEPELQEFIHSGADWAIFTTGIGFDTLLHTAENLGIKEDFLTIIHQANVGSRGYKTLGALKKQGIQPIAVDEDGTTKGLTRSLEKYDFTDKRVMIQLHGETAPALTKFFEDRGATVVKLLPYQHISPEQETVMKLCNEIMSKKVDAVCFTTAIQVRSLFEFAKQHSIDPAIVESFQCDVIATAVGKVTAEALREEGVERLITPENERMGAMIIELAHFYQG